MVVDASRHHLCRSLTERCDSQAEFDNGRILVGVAIFPATNSRGEKIVMRRFVKPLAVSAGAAAAAFIVVSSAVSPFDGVNVKAKAKAPACATQEILRKGPAPKAKAGAKTVISLPTLPSIPGTTIPATCLLPNLPLVSIPDGPVVTTPSIVIPPLNIPGTPEVTLPTIEIPDLFPTTSTTFNGCTVDQLNAQDLAC